MEDIQFEKDMELDDGIARGEEPVIKSYDPKVGMEVYTIDLKDNMEKFANIKPVDRPITFVDNTDIVQTETGCSDAELKYKHNRCETIYGPMWGPFDTRTNQQKQAIAKLIGQYLTGRKIVDLYKRGLRYMVCSIIRRMMIPLTNEYIRKRIVEFGSNIRVRENPHQEDMRKDFYTWKYLEDHIVQQTYAEDLMLIVANQKLEKDRTLITKCCRYYVEKNLPRLIEEHVWNKVNYEYTDGVFTDWMLVDYSESVINRNILQVCDQKMLNKINKNISKVDISFNATIFGNKFKKQNAIKNERKLLMYGDNLIDMVVYYLVTRHRGVLKVFLDTKRERMYPKKDPKLVAAQKLLAEPDKVPISYVSSGTSNNGGADGSDGRSEQFIKTGIPENIVDKAILQAHVSYKVFRQYHGPVYVKDFTTRTLSPDA